MFAVVWATDIAGLFRRPRRWADRSCGRGSARRRPGRAFSAGSLAAVARFLVAWIVRGLGACRPSACAIRHAVDRRLGGEPDRRPRRIRPEAPFRREGFEPPDPRPWRRDGSPRRLLGGLLPSCGLVLLSELSRLADDPHPHHPRRHRLDRPLDRDGGRGASGRVPGRGRGRRPRRRGARRRRPAARRPLRRPRGRERGGTALKAALAGSGHRRPGPGRPPSSRRSHRDGDIVLAAISGTAGLEPTQAALEARPRASPSPTRRASSAPARPSWPRRAALGADILPVDSEHNALDQALAAGRTEDVAKAIITATGGPFRTWTRERIAAATPAEAAAHPVWSMGAKINIDSATLMNKGLELIEAHHLFGIDAGAPRRPRASGGHRPRPGPMARRRRHGGARPAGHEDPDRERPATRRTSRHRSGPRLDLAAIWPIKLRAGGRRTLSLPDARASGACGRRCDADDPQRRQRDRGRGLYGRPDRLLRHRRELVERVCERMALAGGQGAGDDRRGARRRRGSAAARPVARLGREGRRRRETRT